MIKKIPTFHDVASKIENELDFDFRAECNRIDSMDEFMENIIAPYNDGKRIFFRGEKIKSIDRPLMPSIYRNKSQIFSDGEIMAQMNAEKLLGYYNQYPDYFDVFQKVIGKINRDNMYSFLAFSQHYFGVSPLIDLTKNPFVSLSFALKNREVYEEDILLYTVEIKNEDDYTNSIEVANKWIEDYNVLVLKEFSKDALDTNISSILKYKDLLEDIREKSIFDLNTPSAKLIDVPTNDLMRFQQGVFLLLDDFIVFGKGYLTKKIRDEFAIKKWIISKDICPDLLKYQLEEAPYYNYDNITDLSSVIGSIKKQYI